MLSFVFARPSFIKILCLQKYTQTFDTLYGSRELSKEEFNKFFLGDIVRKRWKEKLEGKVERNAMLFIMVQSQWAIGHFIRDATGYPIVDSRLYAFTANRMLLSAVLTFQLATGSPSPKYCD